MSQVPAWFDDKAYFANKMAQVNETATTQYEAADFAAALKAAGVDPNNPESLYNHFVNFGNAEGVSPNGYFDADAYIANKAAQAGSTVEAVEQAFKDAGLSAWDHYQAFGTKEGINPSASFNTDEYLQAKVDYELAKGNAITLDQLKATLAENNLSALEHYYLYGQTEGVSYSPADYPAFPAIPVDGGYEPLPDDGLSLADFKAKSEADQPKYYIQDTIDNLKGATFDQINTAKGIYVEDTIDNLKQSDAASYLAKAQHVIIADSLDHLVKGSLPSFGSTPTSLLVTSASDTVNFTDVTVSVAADAQNTLDDFLARSDVEYAKGVTKPTELTVGTYSIKDTAAAVAAADATLLDDAGSVTVADTMAALTSNFSLIDSGDITGVELKDSLTNIANASTTIIKGLMGFAGDFTVAATNTGSAKVNYTDALDALASGGADINVSSLDKLSVVAQAESTTQGATLDTEDLTLFSGADSISFIGTKQADTFTIADTANIANLSIDGGADTDSLTINSGSKVSTLDFGDRITNIETIEVNQSGASTFSMTADGVLTSLEMKGGSGALTLDATNASALTSVKLIAANAATDTIKIGDATSHSLTISGFVGGSGADSLDISAPLDGAALSGKSGSTGSAIGDLSSTSTNVILYTGAASIDSLSDVTVKENTDYVVIAASGSGAAVDATVYMLNSSDGKIETGDLVKIAQIDVETTAIISDNIDNVSWS